MLVGSITDGGDDGSYTGAPYFSAMASARLGMYSLNKIFEDDWMLNNTV